MKIVYLANMGLPVDWAHSLQIMRMCSSLSKSGNQVELVVPDKKTGVTGEPFEYYGIDKTFKITKVPCIDFATGSDARWVFYVRTVSFLFFARIYLWYSKYDVLYTRERLVLYLFKNVVFELHALPDVTVRKYGWLFKKCSALVVLTQFIKQRLVSAGVHTDNIIVEPDAVSLEVFGNKIDMIESRMQLKLPTKDILMGYVGTLKTMGMEKGVGPSIDALVSLPSNIKLVIVGGEAKDIIFYKKYVADRKLDERVIFVGQVSNSLVPQYLAAFNMLVAPFPDVEHYRYFMSPLKIFEYMAARRPIITSDLPSLREVLDESVAILTPPGDAYAVAQSVQALADNPQAGEAMASRAFERVKEYTWDKRAQRIVDFVSSQNKV